MRNPFKKLIPTYINESIYSIDFNKVASLNVKYILCDLDNTLSSPFMAYPSKKMYEFLNELSQKFIVIILSNNHENRVKLFVKNLNIDYVFEVKKPKTKKLRKYFKINNINVNDCLYIGDQIITDILIANRFKIKNVLVNPLTNKDEPITFFPRMLDKIFRKINESYKIGNL